MLWTDLSNLADGAPQTSGRSTSPAASVISTASPRQALPPASPVNGHGPPVNTLMRNGSLQLNPDSAQPAPAHAPHVDMLGELPPARDVRDGAESPSISDDEQYQKLDGDLWQQGEVAGRLGSGARPAGTLVAPDAEPEVHLAEKDDRKVDHKVSSIFLLAALSALYCGFAAHLPCCGLCLGAS